MKNETKRKLSVVGIEIVIAFLHFIGIGLHSSIRMFLLSASYFSDLALPFGFYFLLKLNEDKIASLQKWWVKAFLVFLMVALSEIGQFFGLYIFGRTFDPIDFIVYAVGVLLAASFDWILSVTVAFWPIGTKKPI